MKAEITITETGNGSITLDGHDVASHVRGFYLRGAVGQVTTLELDLAAFRPSTFSGEVAVTLAPEVADLLLLMGWTPPRGRA